MATTTKSYSEKLKDPRWQKKRLEVLEAGLWECGDCGEKDKTLNVHHCWYERGVEPWGYPDECYRVLCDVCHSVAEETRLRVLVLLASAPSYTTDLIIGLLEAEAAHCGPRSFPSEDNFSSWDQVTGAELFRFYEVASRLARSRISDWQAFRESEMEQC